MCSCELCRTPDARDRLSARSCNAVLARATLEMLDLVLMHIQQAEEAVLPGVRGGAEHYESMRGQISVPHLANRGTLQSYMIPSGYV
jgi:hypothetical protein